jgi:hypothetical protein
MRALRLFCAVLLLAVFAAGCSSLRIGYAAMPTVLAWRIDRYLALDDEQRALVGERIESLQRWHRENELPRYSAWLDRMASVPVPVSEATIAGWRGELAEAWVPLANRLAPDLAALALTLRPEQIARMSARFAESNRDLRRDWGLDKRVSGSSNPVLEARTERFRDRAEFFLGSLGGYQVELLRRLAAEHPPTEADWLAEREARQRGLVDLLSRISGERPPVLQAEEWARTWLLSAWQSTDPQRAVRLQAAAAASDRGAATILNMATAAQRDRMSAKIRGYAADIATIASR